MAGETSPLQRMANVIGHELRNPLAVINNSVYLVKMKLGASADAKVAKHIGIIESEVRRANELIADILSFGRPFEPALKPASARELLSGAVSAASVPEGVVVKVEADKESVLADAEALTRVLRRLIDNAVEAMEGRGALTLRAKADGRWVCFEVSDTGPGLPAEVQAKLFEPFVTTKPRGLGLSLATARKVVERHHGTIEPLAAARGAAFRLRLPRAAE